MKTPIEALLVVAVLFAQGCVERTDLSPVYEETATRSEIEAVLGEPVASRATEEGHISIYQYNTGEAAEVSEAYESWMVGLTLFTLVGGFPLAIIADSTPQKGFLAVFYSADDDPTNIHLVGSGDPDAQMDRLVAGLELKRRAYQGDAKASYEYALRINDSAEAWKFHCLAANQNHPDAQALVANHHRWGLDPVERDVLRAYVWYRLAELNGYEGRQSLRTKTEIGGWKCCTATPYSEALAANMTPSELADGCRALPWRAQPHSTLGPRGAVDFFGSSRGFGRPRAVRD